MSHISRDQIYDFLYDHYHHHAPHTPQNQIESIIHRDIMSMTWRQTSRLHIADYKKYQVLDGPGIRHSLYVSYCPFSCAGCYNTSAQSARYGTQWENSDLDRIIDDLHHDRVSGLTLVGGEPFLNAVHLVPLVENIRKIHPGKTIWSYTGFLTEILLDSDDEKYELLKLCDVVVDGQFIAQERDESNLAAFRGSNNQRLVDVAETLDEGHVVSYQSSRSSKISSIRDIDNAMDSLRLIQ